MPLLQEPLSAAFWVVPLKQIPSMLLYNPPIHRSQILLRPSVLFASFDPQQRRRYSPKNKTRLNFFSSNKKPNKRHAIKVKQKRRRLGTAVRNEVPLKRWRQDVRTKLDEVTNKIVRPKVTFYKFSDRSLVVTLGRSKFITNRNVSIQRVVNFVADPIPREAARFRTTIPRAFSRFLQNRLLSSVVAVYHRIQNNQNDVERDEQLRFLSHNKTNTMLLNILFRIF